MPSIRYRCLPDPQQALPTQKQRNQPRPKLRFNQIGVFRTVGTNLKPTCVFSKLCFYRLCFSNGSMSSNGYKRLPSPQQAFLTRNRRNQLQQGMRSFYRFGNFSRYFWSSMNRFGIYIFWTTSCHVYVFFGTWVSPNTETMDAMIPQRNVCFDRVHFFGTVIPDSICLCSVPGIYQLDILCSVFTDSLFCVRCSPTR